MKALSRLFTRKAKSNPTFDAPLAPAASLAIIGDIHGTDGLVARLLDKLEPYAPEKIIFVGDYVDRGEQSAHVLARLYKMAQTDPRCICLKGNHEAMMLEFLDDPLSLGPRWLRNGGLQTLASYGIGKDGLGTEARMVAARDALARALGPDLLGWLRALPTRFVSGNVAVVHAGADPERAIEDQPDMALLWGYPGFNTRPRSDGIWVVHGHTITSEVIPRDGRIGVDTGAFANGRLSAVVIESNRFEVVSASWNDPLPG
jgi:serine/threonine protein phosphatase 1